MRTGGGSSDDAVIKRVLLGVVGPVGWGHAAVGVQQDAEAAHDQQGQEDEEQQHKDEGGLLLQCQVGRHVMAATWRGQRAAEEALGHPGHIHAWSSRLQLFVGCWKIWGEGGLSGQDLCENPKRWIIDHVLSGVTDGTSNISSLETEGTPKQTTRTKQNVCLGGKSLT